MVNIAREKSIQETVIFVLRIVAYLIAVLTVACYSFHVKRVGIAGFRRSAN